ncbi:MAG TPA: tetratricopeptide repeat protein [Planctomycetes bacterium]|nr:tetratricopeptide repeat protein [Planctomycetota bacterium]
MAERVMKYNPAFLSEEELIKSFVVRHEDLELIMQTIRENVTESNQHIMVIGQRGIGKTMLVLRAAAEVRKNKELHDKWYPVVFSEESYQVSTSGEFWLEALFHLGQQEKSARWKQTYRELREEDNQDRLRERALSQLMDFADAQGKRILIIAENFNMLLGDQISDDDAWKLRHTLSNEPRIMLLATATSRFKEIESSDKAMFELFKVQELKPLDEAECRKIWASITGKELHEERIRPIQILTGGNPRLIRILSSFGASMSFKELMDDLIQLVDDHTEYFKSHLDRLAPTERKVYLSLAELWDPSTASEVAKEARLNVSKTSALLGRLMERGAIVVSKEKSRKKWYQVAERMYNIYYLMRRRGAPSRRIKGVVNFMVNFYRQEELIRITGKLAEEACKLDAQFRRDHYTAYETVLENISSQVFREKILDITPKSFFEMDDAPKSIRSLIEREKPTTVTKEEEEWSALLKEADKLSEKPDRLKEAESTYRRAIEIAPNKALSWLMLGVFLQEKTERYDEAEKAYRRAIELDEKYAPNWTLLGWILHEKLERYDEAENAYRKAIELDEKYAPAWGNLGLLLHYKLERYDEAENAYRKAIELDEKYAPAWGNLGSLLHYKLERYDDAENAYRKVIELDEKYAPAWGNLGSLLHYKLERYEEAENAYRKAIELDPDLDLAWGKLIELLISNLKRPTEAFNLAKGCIERTPENAELLNSFAWNFYKYGQGDYLGKAAEWARRAVEIKPDNGYCQHTLATILATLGKKAEALEFAQRYLADSKTVQATIDDAISLFVELAAHDYAKEALGILKDSESAKILEPLVVGLQLYVGEEVNTAVEIMEIGKDVVKRIQKRRDKISD